MLAWRRWAVVGITLAWLVGVVAAALIPGINTWRVPLLICSLGLLGAMVIATAVVSRIPSVAALRWLIIALWLGASVALGMARFAWSGTASDPLNIAHAGFGQTITVQGIVAGEPDERVKGAYLTITVTQVQFVQYGPAARATGTVRVFAAGLASQFSPEYGDTLEFTGVVSPPTHAPPGIDAEMGAPLVRILARGGRNPLLSAIYMLRERLAGAIGASLPAPEAALLIGILLGLKTPLLRALLPLYTRTGTIHLVVTSGLKVTLVGDLIASMTRRLGQHLCLALSLGGIAGYVVLSGAGPAAIRAGIMGVLLVLARFLRRDYDVFTALAVAALVMSIIAPTVLWDAGFQLSAAGTLGIAVLGGRLRVPLARWLSWMRGSRTIADVLASTLAAQLATLPIVAITFGLISLIAPVTNLLLVPLLPLFLLLGALLGGVGVLAPSVGMTLGTILWPLLRLADLVIEIAARIPGAALMVGAIPTWLIPLWITGIACVPLIWRPPGTAPHVAPTARLPLPLRAGIAVTLVLTLFVASVGIASAARPPDVTVRFMDVGPSGPAAVIRLVSGRTVLIDGGADGPALLTALADALPFWQHSIDLVILTDARPGHLLGLQAVLHAYHVGQVADPGVLHPTQAYTAWYANLQAAYIPLTRLTRGAVLQLAPTVRLDVLGPPRPLVAHDPDEQDTNALILRLVTPGLRVLFAGDATDRALAQIMDAGADLRSDVVQFCQLPNEGLLVGTAQVDLLDLAQPRLVVVVPSARPAPKAGTPDAAPTPDDPEAIAGMTVMHTSDAGAITLQSDGGGWGVEH